MKVMKKETIDLLNKISNDDLFKNNEFVLIGGTALSIHSVSYTHLTLPTKAQV